VIRTSVDEAALSSENAVRAYKDPAKVERAFRSMKTIDLHVRPIYHWLDERIKAHVFLSMLSYYVEWHMRKRLAAILFDDHDKESAEASRQSIVAPAPRSEAAKRKDLTKRTELDQPVHSFRSLLADLGTLCKNRVRLLSDPPAEFYLLRTGESICVVFSIVVRTLRVRKTAHGVCRLLSLRLLLIRRSLGVEIQM
jgi:hypothetical protein